MGFPLNHNGSTVIRRKSGQTPVWTEISAAAVFLTRFWEGAPESAARGRRVCLRVSEGEYPLYSKKEVTELVEDRPSVVSCVCLTLCLCLSQLCVESLGPKRG